MVTGTGNEQVGRHIMSAKLARLEIIHFRYALPTPVPTAMGPLRHRPALLLRLEDSEGFFGWGEIWCNFPPDGDLHRARLALNVLGAALSGLEVATDKPFEAIRRRLRRLVLQAGEPGPVAQISAGLDIALCDLRARRVGQPLAVWLGGHVRPVPAYASGISPDHSAEQIERMRRLGYFRFKQRIGFGPDDGLGAAEETASALAADEKLMVDANQAWDLETARRQCRRLAPLDLLWIEEPLPADAPLEDWVTLAQEMPMPIAAGENIASDEAFEQAVGATALRYLQPDICKWGGLSGGAVVARAAEAAGITYCPHFLGGGVGLIASAHLLSAIGGQGLLEVDGSENPLLEALCWRDLSLTDGMFALPKGMGLGYDPDMGAVADLLTSHEEVRL